LAWWGEQKEAWKNFGHFSVFRLELVQPQFYRWEKERFTKFENHKGMDRVELAFSSFKFKLLPIRSSLLLLMILLACTTKLEPLKRCKPWAGHDKEGVITT
jgi:hypothetical protein